MLAFELDEHREMLGGKAIAGALGPLDDRQAFGSERVFQTHGL